MRESTNAIAPILVADAHDDTRALYRHAFGIFDRAIVEARDGREALIAALGQTPALIVTELSLAHIDGFAFCELLRSDPATRHVPIVVGTAVSAADKLADRRIHAVEAVFIKPFVIEEFAAAAAAILRRSAASGDAPQPLLRPPVVRCPRCDRPLVHSSSHVGGLRNDEQWDYFRCWSCGRSFQYRHRTRTLRATA